MNLNLKQLIKEAIKEVLEEVKFNPRVLDVVFRSDDPSTFPADKEMEKKHKEETQWRYNRDNEQLSVNQKLERKINWVSTKYKLQKLGSGSSRTVFRLDSKRVLKMASNVKGLAQNKAEIEISKDKQYNKILANVLYHAEDNSWLVSDIVKELTSIEEFKQLAGVPWELASMTIAIASSYNDSIDQIKQKIEEDYTYYHAYTFKVENLKNYLARPFINSLISLIQLKKLQPADLNFIEHWGKTPDQRAVILDYGFTEAVRKQHYNH